jgi:DNA-binding CsgD family transcriptional regulator
MSAREPDSAIDSTNVPQYVGAAAEHVLEARGNEERLLRTFERSRVPMLIVDGERYYVEVNAPARLAFRATLAELRARRIQDLTPEHFWPTLDEAWGRLMETGCVAGDYEVASLDGGLLNVVYWAAADALPGLHLIAFAPLGWSRDELGDEGEQLPGPAPPPLTPRELEVLELAAEGRTGPSIAEDLFVSPATVRTHFEHIYEKLGVGDRAAAVARAMRLGLIT